MEKDILGESVDEVARILRASRLALNDLTPLGPKQVKMSNRELRRAVEVNPGIMERMQQSGSAGAQEALGFLLGGGKNLGPHDTEEYVREEANGS
jgi:hypothetical protein